tara:strand:- start:287 stop:496 length:210 start_codon:yes stop_codon:yes gene_type:complete
MNKTQIPHFDVDVQLTDNDGNALAIMRAVVRGLKKAGATPVDVDNFRKEAMSGDYNNLLATAQRWVVCL